MCGDWGDKKRDSQFDGATIQLNMQKKLHLRIAKFIWLNGLRLVDQVEVFIEKLNMKTLPVSNLVFLSKLVSSCRGFLLPHSFMQLISFSTPAGSCAPGESHLSFIGHGKLQIH